MTLSAKRCVLRLYSLLLCTVIAASVNADTPESPQVVPLWVWGITSTRIAYEEAVIGLALERTRADYGDFLLIQDNEHRSIERAIRELRDGKTIAMRNAPIWRVNLQPDPPMTVIPTPLANGLMGYRRLIVRREDLPRFQAIQSLDDLRQFSAGQGAGWSDIAVLQHADLPVVEGANIAQLYTMLTRKRFDYFPLGALEVEDSLAASGYAEQLAIVPELVIYYPLHIHIQVSVNRPELSERLTLGLASAKRDGSLDALFEEHYGDFLETLRTPTPRVIVLENPNLPEDLGRGQPELLPDADIIR